MTVLRTGDAMRPAEGASLIAADISDEVLIALFASEEIDRDSMTHFRGRLSHRLLINRCQSCGFWHHPPRGVCPRCWSLDVLATEVSGRGTVALATRLHHGPAAPEVDYQRGHWVIAVELMEQAGLRVTATITDWGEAEPSIGQSVECAWATRDEVPVLAFRPFEAR